VVNLRIHSAHHVQSLNTAFQEYVSPAKITILGMAFTPAEPIKNQLENYWMNVWGVGSRVENYFSSVS
jgi:hypothetical protein